MANYFSQIAVSFTVTKLTLSMLVPLFAATGCEKHVVAENIEVVNRQQAVAEKRESKLENVQEGLTMKEVEAVLGSPTEVRTGKVTRTVEKEFDFATWTYREDGPIGKDGKPMVQEVELSFIDGKLQGKVPKFGEKLNPVAPLQMKNGQNGNHRNLTPEPR